MGFKCVLMKFVTVFSWHPDILIAIRLIITALALCSVIKRSVIRKEGCFLINSFDCYPKIDISQLHLFFNV